MTYSILPENRAIDQKLPAFILVAGQSAKCYHFDPMMGQIATVLLFAVMSGADNLQVACGLGMLPIGRGRKWALGASFGVCEAMMSLAGLVGGLVLRGHGFGAAGLGGGLVLAA